MNLIEYIITGFVNTFRSSDAMNIFLVKWFGLEYELLPLLAQQKINYTNKEFNRELSVNNVFYTDTVSFIRTHT